MISAPCDASSAPADIPVAAHSRRLWVDDSHPFRVLVVDDEAAQRALEREILLPPKYEVIEAENGDQALALLAGQRFDVVLLDKRMPGIDGDEVCRRIRNQLGETLLPVIMVTGSGATEELATSLRAGASDFVRKPYHPLELIARTDAAVRHKRMTDQFDNAESMLFALARMVESKDTNTGDHCARLSHTAVVFGRALGLNLEELMALRRGGVLHDIGKLGVPDLVLLKSGPLTEDEWVLMRQHPVIGGHLCSGLKSMRLTVPIIRYHHERWDGGGYPYGLKGEEIPLLARVFRVVDIYDALTSVRPYKQALPREEAIRAIEEEVERGWCDPVLSPVFLDIARDHPELLDVPSPPVEDLGSTIFNSILASTAADRGWKP